MTAALKTTPIEDETIIESIVSSNVFGGRFSGCITPEKWIDNILFGDSLLLLTTNVVILNYLTEPL